MTHTHVTGGMGVSCLVRVEGRVALKSVKTMAPSFVSVASVLHDREPETAHRWDYIEKLVQQVVDESRQIQMLRLATAEKSLNSKLVR